MNLQPNKPIVDVREALAAADNILKPSGGLESNPRKPGYPYYQKSWGTQVYRMIDKLLAVPSKTLQKSLLRSPYDSRTVQAQFTQGRQWLIDGGVVDKWNYAMAEGEWNAIRDAVELFTIKRTRNLITFSLRETETKDIEDFFDGLTEVPREGDAGFDVFQFREEVQDFFANAPQDSHKTWVGVDAASREWAEVLTKQDKHYIHEWIATTKQLTLLHVSPEVLSALEG
jgi:hypothetical protein